MRVAIDTSKIGAMDDDRLNAVEQCYTYILIHVYGLIMVIHIV